MAAVTRQTTASALNRWLPLLLAPSWLACAEPVAPSSARSEAPPDVVPDSPHAELAQGSPSERGAPPAGGTFQSLSLSGFLPALVYVPAAAQKPWPLVVATHGAGGSPEWECEYWRRLTAGRVFLACLRGTPIDVRVSGSFYYRNHLELGREFEAANAAVASRFGAQIDWGSAVYAGFSQGAIMGVSMIVPHAKRFRRLALIEGGYEYWSAATARAFAKNGGERVLFVCGTRWCADKAEIPAGWLRKANVEVRVDYAPGAGHTPAGEVMAKVRSALPFLFDR
jgi:predicted esterase